jgi:hypothetical protein
MRAAFPLTSATTKSVTYPAASRTTSRIATASRLPSTAARNRASLRRRASSVRLRETA